MSMTRTVVVCICTAAVACGSATGPTPLPLSQTQSTAHYSFHYSAGDGVDAEWQESFHAWIVQALGVSTDRTVTYNKYLSRAQMESLTGVVGTNAYADRETFTLHTMWRNDNHEVVHLLVSTFAVPGPAALFNEGIAVAHQVNPAIGDFVPKWSGVAVDDLARGYRASGRLPAIRTIATTTGFRAFDSNLGYPIAGSFMKYVRGRFGLAATKAFFARGTPNDSVETISAACLDVFGLSLDQIEADWLAALDAGR